MIFRTSKPLGSQSESVTHLPPFEEDDLEDFRIGASGDTKRFRLEEGAPSRSDSTQSAPEERRGKRSPIQPGTDHSAFAPNKSVPTSTAASSNGATRRDASPGSGLSISPRLRDDLAAAVIAWWQSAALPSETLLKDALLALEAGVSLEPSQRTLLGRTALARGKGIITALRHVNDPERVASLVHEAWMNGTLNETGLDALLREPRLGDAWRRAFANDLRAGLSPYQTPTSQRSDTGLQRLSAALSSERSESSGDAYALLEESSERRSARWFYLLALLLAAALVAIWFWQTRTPNFGDVVEISGGIHQFTDPGGATLTAELSSFVIDRTEVTNRQYAACYAAGECPYPNSIDAPGRPSYYLDEQFASYPAVNISWEAANAFCQWRGMRLPSIAEFEVAARHAPLTNRSYRFPWGDIFSSAYVVSADGSDGTATVGSRSPQGDSPLGVADLVGNVSEWTVTSPAAAPQLVYIKGGSWRDAYSEDSTLLPANSQTYPKTDSSAWLGFRCVAPQP